MIAFVSETQQNDFGLYLVIRPTITIQQNGLFQQCFLHSFNCSYCNKIAGKFYDASVTVFQESAKFGRFAGINDLSMPNCNVDVFVDIPGSACFKSTGILIDLSSYFRHPTGFFVRRTTLLI
jgi:hypothetical protein